MNHAESAFLVIRSLLERHIGDAAFYWQQHDQSAHSALIGLQALWHFDRLLNAHLNGVRTAGEAGWQLALQALERWGGAGELFVCATLALEQRREAWQQPVFAAVQRNPVCLLRGLISATLWLPIRPRREFIEQWSRPDATELMQTAAWCVLARCGGVADGQALQTRFDKALRHPGLWVRAAACRASACLRLTEQIPACLRDEAGEVAVEAAIALQRAGSEQGRAKLQTTVIGVAGYLDKLGAHDRQRAQHRLERWLRYLALSLPPASPDVENLLAQLPPRLRLSFILHHGDAAWLPLVREQMYNPECARLAGRVWSILVGVDLETHGLALPIPSRDAGREFPTDNLDLGLPMPNERAVAGFGLSLPEGQRTLLGRSLDRLDRLDLYALLRNAPQNVRWIAARHLEQRESFTFNTSAPAREQSETMERHFRG
ncbi:MAG: hypothetical protein LBF61_11060 [Azoarcus sp.]|jgi:hypothetical protein|nr:hypothetical protein [Azoarcus sp.]